MHPALLVTSGKATHKTTFGNQSNAARMNPSEWNVIDVSSWARDVAKLSDATISALTENEVNGATLVTLTKAELKSELEVNSLSGRRYLWDAIERIRHQHHVEDLSVAVNVHEAEIENLAAPDSHHIDSAVIDTLQSDAVRQRQVIEDHMFARRLQRGLTMGQQVYEDSEIAREEQERVDQQHVQSEYDRQYALSLSQNPIRNSVQQNDPNEQVASLFATCIDVCVKNKINVAEELDTGRVKVIQQPLALTLGQANEAIYEPGVEEQKEEPPELSSQFIQECNVCLDENLFGFHLACGHLNCRKCLRQLFRTAIKDTSLLPLRCCNIPIDMNVSYDLLRQEEAIILKNRVIELTAERKMYCPVCNAFINLDLVDTSEAVDMPCHGCGVSLCAECTTESHPELPCKLNQVMKAGGDKDLMEMAEEMGWKQCPNCKMMIELSTGCNHMTCESCKHGFCFKCLRPWDKKSGLCTSGNCEVWDEDRLLESGEARVVAEEHARGFVFQPEQRRARMNYHTSALQTNETCYHEWTRRDGYFGACERCGYDLWAYAMVCNSDCSSTVCYTCAHHRIPDYGWG